MLRKQDALFLIVVAVGTLTVMLNIGKVYAQTIILTPNSVSQGMSVQASASGVAGSGTVYVWNTSTCFSGTVVLSVLVPSGSSYSVTFSTSTIPVGTHCVSDSYDSDPATLTVTPAATTSTTTASPIPEYPYGLPLLPIFAMITAFGIIKRGIRFPNKAT